MVFCLCGGLSSKSSKRSSSLQDAPVSGKIRAASSLGSSRNSMESVGDKHAEHTELGRGPPQDSAHEASIAGELPPKCDGGDEINPANGSPSLGPSCRAEGEVPNATASTSTIEARMAEHFARGRTFDSLPADSDIPETSTHDRHDSSSSRAYNSVSCAVVARSNLKMPPIRESLSLSRPFAQSWSSPTTVGTADALELMRGLEDAQGAVMQVLSESVTDHAVVAKAGIAVDDVHDHGNLQRFSMPMFDLDSLNSSAVPGRSAGYEALRPFTSLK